MTLKKLLLVCLLISESLFIYQSDAYASSIGEQSGTVIGVHILDGGQPPSPQPPSPSIHNSIIDYTGKLPRTGAIDSYWWFVIGSILIILIIYLKFSLWLRDKERSLSDEKS